MSQEKTIREFLSLPPPPTNTTIIHLSQLSFLLEVSGEVELPTQKHTHRRMAANVADKFKIIVRFRLYNLGSRARYGSAALFTVYPSIRLRCARVRKAHSKLRTKAKKSVMSENRTPTYGLKEAQLCLNVSKIAQIFEFGCTASRQFQGFWFAKQNRAERLFRLAGSVGKSTTPVELARCSAATGRVHGSH